MLIDGMADQTTQLAAEHVAQRKTSRGWLVLLVLPYVGLCFPQMYVRLTPVLWGFPFFYWYQFGWVLLASGLLGIFYLKTKASSLTGKTARQRE